MYLIVITFEMIFVSGVGNGGDWAGQLVTSQLDNWQLATRDWGLVFSMCSIVNYVVPNWATGDWATGGLSFVVFYLLSVVYRLLSFICYLLSIVYCLLSHHKLINDSMNYPPKEERLNTLTHGLGGLLAIAGSVLMVYYAAVNGSALAVVCASIYGASLILLYFASTAYHGVRNPKWKKKLQVVDHLCIYLLIAGTYTPVVLLGIGGAWGWTLFSIIWGLAILGFVFRLSSFKKSERISLALYVLMGWLIVVGIKPVLENIPGPALLLFALGGIFYTSGIYFYVKDKIRFNHAIWHVFVMAGSLLHFFGVFFYLIP
jgi:hemolysin III